MKKILILILAVFLAAGSQAAERPDDPVAYPGKGRREALLALQQFFKSYDTAVLRRLKKPVAVADTEDAARTAADGDIIYMQQKNGELIQLLSALNPVTYNPGELSAADEMLVYAGIMEVYREMQGSRTVTGRAGFPWDCIRNVIVGVFTASSIIDQFVSMVSSGASWVTIRPLLWQSLRRFGGWFTVAGVIWDITTKCF